jgi:hypothetical protein
MQRQSLLEAAFAAQVTTGERHVASIIVVADADAGDASGFLFKEHVSASLLDDPHCSSQLIERMGWALADAEKAERARDRCTR